MMDEIHQCGLCNRKLKTAKSIERGYGAYCYKKVMAAKAKAEFKKNQVKLIDGEGEHCNPSSNFYKFELKG